jgi:hypothetical protein
MALVTTIVQTSFGEAAQHTAWGIRTGDIERYTRGNRIPHRARRKYNDNVSDAILTLNEYLPVDYQADLAKRPSLRITSGS